MESERANQLAHRIIANDTVHSEDVAENICEKRNPMINGCRKSAAVFPLSRSHCLNVSLMPYRSDSLLLRLEKYMWSQFFLTVSRLAMPDSFQAEEVSCPRFERIVSGSFVLKY